VAETVWAAHQAQLPPGCHATVWLLDDGRDDYKASWVDGLSTSSIRYLSGRHRSPGCPAVPSPIQPFETSDTCAFLWLLVEEV
jgi:hypothetical protein